MQPSSRDLHPRTGARFVFDREDHESEPRYRVAIYLPEGQPWVGELRWIEQDAALEPAVEASDGRLAWAHAEALKLARVLRRDPKQHMVRWRG